MAAVVDKSRINASGFRNLHMGFPKTLTHVASSNMSFGPSEYLNVRAFKPPFFLWPGLLQVCLQSSLEASASRPGHPRDAPSGLIMPAFMQIKYQYTMLSRELCLQPILPLSPFGPEIPHSNQPPTVTGPYRHPPPLRTRLIPESVAHLSSCSYLTPKIFLPET